MKATGTNTAQRMSAIMMTDRFHCRFTWIEAVLEMMMYGFDDNDKTMASSTIIPAASTRPNQRESVDAEARKSDEGALCHSAQGLRVSH